MSEEGKDGVETPEVEEVKPDPTTGKLPEMIPSKQYIATKESLGNKIKTEKEKVNSLEEQLKNAPNKEEHDKLVQQLADKTAELEKATNELNQSKEKSASEMREALKKAGVPEDKLEGASEAELKRLIDVLGSKPKSLPDLSGGGGGSGGVPTGSPMQLARSAYEQSGKK